jgi:hypothetical protein
MKRIYRLRWIFKYSDHKPDKIGVWNDTSGDVKTAAWAVSKENLACVIVQGEDQNCNLKNIVVMEGHKYASMQWEAYSLIAPFGTLTIQRPRAFISGLSILTNEEKITVRVDGEIHVRQLTNHDKKFDIIEHKTGVIQ